MTKNLVQCDGKLEKISGRDIRVGYKAYFQTKNLFEISKRDNRVKYSKEFTNLSKSFQ